MTNSGTVAQVRAALAAFETGHKTLAELEAVLAAALHNRLATPALAMDVLRDAVAAGRVPPDTLRRLGLEEASDATVARAIEPPSDSIDATGTALLLWQSGFRRPIALASGRRDVSR